MGAERLSLGSLVTLLGADTQIEVWGDGVVWIMHADGSSRMPLREWMENDRRLDEVKNNDGPVEP